MINPLNPGYFESEELRSMGFKFIGKNVKIFKNCCIIGVENIEIADHVRIDSFCTIIASGRGYLKLGSYIHIGSYSLLSAGSGIVLEDFAGLSQRVSIYSRTDDYSGLTLTNPMVPEKYTGVREGEVLLKKHVIVGATSVILPRVTIGEGSSIGALSLITKSLESWGVYSGCPVKKLKERSKNLLELEKQFLG